jgi:23S rRNA (cytosine1962-C5)-methyltransferase
MGIADKATNHAPTADDATTPDEDVLAHDERAGPDGRPPASEYALLDIGGGRRLECFGALIVDRPFAAAVDAPRDAAAWANADLRYDRPSFGGDGWWTSIGDDPPDTAWQMRHDGLTFELRPTPTGQVGFFAEQMEPWRWLRNAIRAPAAPIDILNLFAYTGGSTLAAAIAGAQVTHVDASRPAVGWARRNATLSGLDAAPIRWIVDDVQSFVRREARRGRRYKGLILDPPSYGHGPKGERWTLFDQLPDLLDACLGLLDEPAFVLLTAHAEGLEPKDVGAVLSDAFARSGRQAAAARIETSRLMLRATSGGQAPAGVCARWRAR